MTQTATHALSIGDSVRTPDGLGTVMSQVYTDPTDDLPTVLVGVHGLDCIGYNVTDLERVTVESMWEALQATPSYVERYRGAGVFQSIGDMLLTLREKQRELAAEADNARAQAKAGMLQGIIEDLLEVYGL